MSFNIAIIESTSTKSKSKKEVKTTEFKLNMNQFDFVDKTNFLKQVGELVCAYLVNTSVSRKIAGDFEEVGKIIRDRKGTK